MSSRNKTRYYFHGDRHEEMTDRYLCKFRDLFIREDEFELINNRYRNHAKLYEDLTHEIPFCSQYFRRPRDPYNIIKETSCVVHSKLFKWISRQTLRNNPISGLASAIVRDLDFPRDAPAVSHIMPKLESCYMAPEELIKEFVDEYRRFSNGSSFGARKNIPDKIRFEVFKRYLYVCQICGSKDRLEIDHIVPVSKGGSDDPSNLQPLCYPCNRGKGGNLQ